MEDTRGHLDEEFGQVLFAPRIAPLEVVVHELLARAVAQARQLDILEELFVDFLPLRAVDALQNANPRPADGAWHDMVTDEKAILSADFTLAADSFESAFLCLLPRHPR